MVVKQISAVATDVLADVLAFALLLQSVTKINQ